jgi:hypothetical protein
MNPDPMDKTFGTSIGTMNNGTMNKSLFGMGVYLFLLGGLFIILSFFPMFLTVVPNEITDVTDPNFTGGYDIAFAFPKMSSLHFG